MTSKLNRHPKAVSISFTGFECDPSEVEIALGKKATMVGLRGQPIRPNTTNLRRHSFAIYELEFSEDVRLDEMIPALIEHLGGVEKIRLARQTVAAKTLSFDVYLHVRNSTAQEDGFLEAKTIEDLAYLNASLGFSFP